MATPTKLFTALNLPVLSGLLSDADLKFVDVGGRGHAFAPLAPFARFADYYAFEPDALAAERLREELGRREPWRSVTVVADAVGSRHGTATLHQTRNEGMSSLLEPDPEVAGRFCLARKFAVVSAAPVRVVPLDEAAEQHGFGNAAFLKLDTQGTELDILRSAPRVASAVVGIYTEASFHPFYSGQTLFGELDAWLRRHSFTLFGLNRTMLRRAGYRKEMYSRHMVAWAHCLYLREPDTLPDDDWTALQKRLSALLAVAIGFHHYDLAMEVAALFERSGLLRAADARHLADEITGCAAYGLEHLANRAEENRLQETLTARSLQDKIHLG